jgi:hypothetical protein
MDVERVTNTLSPNEPEQPLSPRAVALAWAVREALRIALRAVEEFANLPRSFETQAERRERRR